MGLYAGDVGEYAGEVGLYAGEVGEYAGEVGEYAGLFLSTNTDTHIIHHTTIKKTIARFPIRGKLTW